jgi:hypothetical protein
MQLLDRIARYPSTRHALPRDLGPISIEFEDLDFGVLR